MKKTITESQLQKLIRMKIREQETTKEFEEKLDAKQREIQELKNDIQVINDTLKKAEETQKIMEKITEVMDLKGFVNEKELEEIKAGKQI